MSNVVKETENAKVYSVRVPAFLEGATSGLCKVACYLSSHLIIEQEEGHQHINRPEAVCGAAHSHGYPCGRYTVEVTPHRYAVCNPTGYTRPLSFRGDPYGYTSRLFMSVSNFSGEMVSLLEDLTQARPWPFMIHGVRAIVWAATYERAEQIALLISPDISVEPFLPTPGRKMEG